MTMNSTPEPVGAISAPEEFLRSARDLGVEFEADDIQRLERFLSLLLDTNRTMNLTSIRDPHEAWMRHILDAMTLLPMLAELPEGARVIDVGSGGGLPGIPLACVLPSLRFTLLEATGKKADFLERAIETLGLSNCDVLRARAEQAGQDRGRRTEQGREGGHRERYDAAIARAVGRLNVVAELCVPLVRVGGPVFLVKGQKADEELEEASGALKTLLVRHAGTVDTPTGRIVVLEKAMPTPRAYPRRDGEPKRAPLI